VLCGLIDCFLAQQVLAALLHRAACACSSSFCLNSCCKAAAGVQLTWAPNGFLLYWKACTADEAGDLNCVLLL
jgi:hypothetical protein